MFFKEILLLGQKYYKIMTGYYSDYSYIHTVRGPTRARMLITKFYTEQNDQSDLSISNSDYKQRQTRKSSSAK